MTQRIKTDDAKPLPERLVDDLLKSGFAAELRVLEIFTAAGWMASSRPEFFDPTLNISRDLDLYAFRQDTSVSSDGQLLLQADAEAWVEVKKSQNPWVILRAAAPDPDASFMVHIFCSPPFQGFVEQRRFRQAAAEYCIVTRNGWCGHGIHEAFKKPNSESQSYSSLVKLARASYEHRQRPSSEYRAPTFPALYYAKTLIVLDGPLFSAHVDNNTVQVTPIAEATIEFTAAQSETKRDALYIDVVTIDALPPYLDFIRKTHARFIEIAEQKA